MNRFLDLAGGLVPGLSHELLRRYHFEDAFRRYGRMLADPPIPVFLRQNGDFSS